jgi:CheY-like chemotaxis protein
MSVVVLVVEDDEVKRNTLVQFIEDSVHDVEVRIARSLQSGLRSVEALQPSLILLDMTLPNYDQTADESGGMIHDLGGLEFVRQLDRDEIVVPVIVVTQYETFGDEGLTLGEINERLRKDYEVGYLGLVLYQSALSSWQREILELAENVPSLHGKTGSDGEG